MSILFVVSQN